MGWPTGIVETTGLGSLCARTGREARKRGVHCGDRGANRPASSDERKLFGEIASEGWVREVAGAGLTEGVSGYEVEEEFEMAKQKKSGLGRHVPYGLTFFRNFEPSAPDMEFRDTY